VASSIMFTDNSAQVFKGSHVAPTHDELANMLGLQANKMASSAEQWVSQSAKALTSDTPNRLAIVVSESFIDGENRFVWVATGSQSFGIRTHKLGLRGSGKSMRDRLVTSILDQFRKHLD